MKDVLFGAVGGALAVAAALALLLSGCATMQFGAMERLVTTAEADAYCRPRVSVHELGPVVHGCWLAHENMIVADSPAVLHHEQKHAAGWDHSGPCHSTDVYPDGLTLDGKPCVWFRSAQ